MALASIIYALFFLNVFNVILIGEIGETIVIFRERI